MQRILALAILLIATSTLKCNTQEFVNAAVARPVKISISNMQKHLGEGTGFPPVHQSAHTVWRLLIESAVRQAARILLKKWGARANNGMQPTGNSSGAICKIGCLCKCFPAGDAGR